MTTEERLPPACAFALSVLEEYKTDADAVPEEAVEAAHIHMTTCARCINAATPASNSTPRKKRKTRRSSTAVMPEIPSAPILTLPPEPPPDPNTGETQPGLLPSGVIDCQQCRQLLPEYAEALDQDQNVASLYPEVQEHLLVCETGCLVLLELCRQEAKATRKYRRKLVRNPFSVIWWEISGFFRSGQVPISPKALAFGTLLLLLLVSSFSTYLGITLYEARTHPPVAPTRPMPDGIGLSDGLKIYDACHDGSYDYKQQAVQELKKRNSRGAETLFQSAISAVSTDTKGCNGAEAAIYRENLHVRQSARPYNIVVVGFDSGPGNIHTDRRNLYAAYTQELVGAFIAQQQYNTEQMKTADAPLLYLVLANTAGTEQGALEVANKIAALNTTDDISTLGLLAKGSHRLLGVLGLGPSKLLQVALPGLCRAGIPLIAPTSTGLFIIDQLNNVSLYRSCAPGFAFIRFSPDDAGQSRMAADYAYTQLKARNAAIFYDPSNPSSNGAAQGFVNSFLEKQETQISARETVIASSLLDENGHTQASRDDLVAALQDALKSPTPPDIIFASLLTNDVTALAQEIAQLPVAKQPILMIGGEFVQPAALQNLLPWARQAQLSLPKLFVVQLTAARPPNEESWQKEFYASYCASFATPNSYCSGAAALDQGALLFADGIKLLGTTLGMGSQESQLPDKAQLVQRLSTQKFAGVSGPIELRLQNTIVTSTITQPVMLSMQQDGSITIVN